MPNNINEIRKALLKTLREKGLYKGNDTGESIKRDEGIMNTTGKDLVNAITPALAKIMENSQVSKESITNDLKEALKELKIEIPPAEITATIPDIYVPEIKAPEVKIPPINIPPIKIPDIVMPKEMDVRGWVQLQGVDLNNPLPVQLRDAKGNPVNMFENLTTLIGQGGGGGLQKIVKISDIAASAFSFVNSDGRVSVELPSGSSGLTDTELRASSVPVAQASGAIWSVYVTDFAKTVGAAIVDSLGVAYSGSNPVPVAGTVAVSGITGTVGANIVDSSGVAYSTSNPVPIDDAGGTITVDGTVAVSGVSGSVAASMIDSSGVGYSGSNPVPIGGTVAVSGINNSVASSLIDSSGVGYSGSNPVPISGSVSVSGSITSTVSVGPVVADAVDDGNAPVQFGGVARTANPTAVSGNDIVKASFDDVGRQLIRPVQVRDLLATAYAALVSGSGYGTETALLAGVAGEYHDLIYIMGSNTSSVAVKADIRASTGGTVIMSLEIPANGTAGVSLPVPLPAPFADQTWTVDLPDETGGDVYISAQFSKEV